MVDSAMTGRYSMFQALLMRFAIYTRNLSYSETWNPKTSWLTVRDFPNWLIWVLPKSWPETEEHSQFAELQNTLRPKCSIKTTRAGMERLLIIGESEFWYISCWLDIRPFMIMTSLTIFTRKSWRESFNSHPSSLWELGTWFWSF